MISHLVTVVSDAKYASDFPTVKAAMSTLGDIRATEAIDVLVSHIGFPGVGVEDDEDTIPPIAEGRISPLAIPTPIERRLPAVGALVNIGEPCIDAVIEKIGTTDSGTERHACVAVLKGLSGPSVRARIEQAIQTAPQKKCEALKMGLKLLDEKPLSAEELKQKLKELLREREPVR